MGLYSYRHGLRRSVRPRGIIVSVLVIVTSSEAALTAADKSRRTLRASLSGIFLQTLPDLVTPLKGALFISAQLSTDAGQRPPKGLGTNMTVEAA